MIYLLLLALAPYGDSSFDKFTVNYRNAYEVVKLEEFAYYSQGDTVFWRAEVRTIRDEKAGDGKWTQWTYQIRLDAHKRMPVPILLTLYSGKELDLKSGDIIDFKGKIESIDQYQVKVSAHSYTLKVNP